MANMLTRAAILLVVVLSYQSYFILKYRNNTFPKNENFNVVQLIQHFGYPVQIHEVSSEGYILTLHRIPHGKNQTNNQTINRIPILFVHGILHSAAEFVNLGPEKALSLLLADENYDIWLANVRGTTWSRKHTILNPDKDQDAYWNFNYHHLGADDLPTVIDYVLKKTNHSKLHYVGFSQGAIIYFVMASERPEYMQKIRLMTAIGPAVYLNNARGPVNKLLGTFNKLLELVFSYFDIHEIFTPNGYVGKFLKATCHEKSPFLRLCLHSVFITQGYNYQQVNTTMLARIYANLPAGVSAKQFSHLNQYFARGRFAKFDYGFRQNLFRYGQVLPPLYNLTKATAPVAVYYGPNDWICTVPDAEKLIRRLPFVVKTYLVPYKLFNHNDFLHAIDADKLLYESIIREIDNY